MKNVHVGWGPIGLNEIRPKHTKLKLNATKVTLELEQSYQIIIESEYEETPVWKSSNENVAIVDQDGNIQVVGYGTTYIIVTSGKSQGVCVIYVPKPVEPEPDPEEPDEPNPDIPDEPESKLDNTKIYYGTIKPTSIKFSDITEDDIVLALEKGTMKTTSVEELDTTITIPEAGDAVVILIPNNNLKAVKQLNKVPFQESLQEYEGTGANGNIKLGEFYLYGEILIVDGTLQIYVE